MNKQPARSKRKKTISIVIPVFNEEENVGIAYQAVRKIFDEQIKHYDFEIVFTDNCSTDGTFTELKKLAEKDKRIRVARFVRNFGFNKSLLTGYRLSSGDAAIQLDCDLQDPPKLFPVFIEKWEAGHDVVVGLREKRPEPVWLLTLRKAFYRLLRRISSDNLEIDGGDFRLVDKSILDKLRGLQDATPYVRGLVSTLATNSASFPYERQARQFGKSKFPLIPLIGLALDGIVNHSILPLRLATLFGIAVATVTFLLALAYAIARLGFNSAMPGGFATSVILELLSISINAIFLGIIGEYVARIYQNLQNRPTTVISDLVNFSG